MYGWLELDPRHGRQGARAYAQAECGLCAHYGQAFRTRTRLLAAADPSLLVLMLEALSEAPPERTRVRCPLTLKVTRRHAMSPEWEPLAAVAELQLILASEKLLDDRHDQEGLLPRVAASLLAADVERAAVRLVARGFPLDELRATLRRQGELEADPSADLDQLASPTAEGLGLIAGWLGALVARPEDPEQGVAKIRHFGTTLGRLLYLVDALHDLVRDRARKRFNPLDAALGPLSPRRLSFLAAHLEGLVAAHCAAFETLPLLRHREVLAASLVEGLAHKGREALARLDGATLSPLPSSAT